MPFLESTDDEVEVPQITQEEFSLEVENRVWSDKNEISYLYHITQLAEELEIEPEDVKRLLSHSLLDKLTNEATQNKLLKTRNTTSSLADF